MLGRVASVVLSLCLMVNVSLGCAMVPEQGIPQSNATLDAVHAYNDCMQAQPLDHKSGKSHATFALSCKTFCASLMIAFVDFKILTLGNHVATPSIDYAAATWDSSVDPPHPRAVLNNEPI